MVAFLGSIYHGKSSWSIPYQKWLLLDLLLQDPWKWCQTCSDLNKKLHFLGCQHNLRQHLKWASFWIQVILSLNHETKDTKIVFPALIRYLPSILPIIHPEISPKCNLRNRKPLAFWGLMIYYYIIYSNIALSTTSLREILYFRQPPCSKWIWLFCWFLRDT